MMHEYKNRKTHKNQLKVSRVKLVCFSFFVIRHSRTGEVSLFFVFPYSFFVIRFSNGDRISYFDIQNPILTFELGPNFLF